MIKTKQKMVIRCIIHPLYMQTYRRPDVLAHLPLSLSLSLSRLSNMLGEEKITENICKFQIAFSQWRAWLIKKLFWDVFLRLASFVFMKNFRSISPAIHILSKKCQIFNHICVKNIFLPNYLRSYTSQKKNY